MLERGHRWPQEKKEEAMRLYAEGRFGSVRELAEHIGVPDKTVEQWKARDTPGNWGELRDRHRQELEQKSRETAADIVANEIEQAHEDNKRIGRLTQDVAEAGLGRFKDHLDHGGDVTKVFPGAEAASRTAETGAKLVLVALDEPSDKTEIHIEDPAAKLRELLEGRQAKEAEEVADEQPPEP